ncbi:MAG: polysaccharide biosynthesis/export family protein [Planctomycetota bacterium]
MPLMRTRMLVLLSLLAVLPGCYTRITNAKEALFYTNPDGTLPGSKSATMIFAHDYNAYLRSKEIDGAGPYLIQPGTLISLEVYGHDIQETLTIRPDGVVDLPLVGEVQAAARTIKEFKEDISQKYATFFVDPPQVIVNTQVTDQDPRVRAGEVSIINPTGDQAVVNLTGDEYLTQALAGASALHPKSEWNQIVIIRRGLKERNERFLIVCDLEKLLRYGDLEQDIRLRNGDIVFVPHEKNTLAEEIYLTFRVLAELSGNFNAITSYIERIEGY